MLQSVATLDRTYDHGRTYELDDLLGRQWCAGSMCRPVRPSGRSIKHFRGIHLGETAWLFGKGPSLDDFDLKDAGPLRAAVSDVIHYIPECLYGFANDACGRWQGLYRPEHVLFQPERVFQNATEPPANPACETIVFRDQLGDTSEILRAGPSEWEARGFARIAGTVTSAIQILAYMGVKSVILVGFDGKGGRSKRKWYTKLRDDHDENYGLLRAELDRTVFAVSRHINCVHWQRPPTESERIPKPPEEPVVTLKPDAAEKKAVEARAMPAKRRAKRSK